jgi:rubrerythrin
LRATQVLALSILRKKDHHPRLGSIPQEDRCETCFGKGTITLMKPAKSGHPIDTSPPPVCPVCKGTKLKPKAN